MNIKHYAEYKDSKIEWMGCIPNNWNVIKLKHVINEFVAGGTPQSSNELFWTDIHEMGIPWVAINDMSTTEYVEKTKKEITKEGLHDKNLKILKKGTLIYSIFATLGKVSILNIDATTNQAILGLITNNKINKMYLKYYLNFLEGKLELFSNSNTQKNLNTEIIKNIEITLPTLDEQQQIAKYLDKKTSDIEENINKNKKLIELLKEKRTALINQAVTKGLNPYTQMKESGIDWIKKIPEHWTVKTFKNVNIFNPTVNINSLNEDSDITYTPMENIKQGLFINQSAKLKDIPNNLTRYEEGDIVLAKVTPCFENGNLAIMNNLYSGFGFGSSELFVIRVKTIYKKFLFYWLQSETFIQKACSTMHGVAGLQRIDSDFIKNSKIPLPNINEQKQIADYLDNQTKLIDKTIEKIEENIELFEEYKESLIHHVVTGKVDIRGVEV